MRLKKVSRKIATILGIALLATNLLAGCGSESKNTNTSNEEPSESTATEESAEVQQVESKDSDTVALINRDENGNYTGPLCEEQQELTIFFGTGTGNFVGSQNFSQELIDNNPAYKKIQENTNIKINYIIPAQGEETTQFNLMISSGNYPDIIVGSSSMSYPGGMDQAVEDGCFIDLTPYAEEYLPNYLKLIKQNDQIYKEATTLENRIAVVYGTYIPEYDGKQLQWWGPAIRKDLLDKAGLDVPETVEDWENVLLTFKDMGIGIPYSMLNTSGMDMGFLAAYGIEAAPMNIFGGIGIYPGEDGKMTYGAIEPGYKDYLTMMNRWYKEGILDPEFMTRSFNSTRDVILAMFGEGSIGSCYTVDGPLPSMIAALESTVEDAEILAVGYPKNVYDGKNPRVTISELYCGSGSWFAVTSNAKDPKLAMTFLDYLSSEEGKMLTNYGVEGESFTMVDGVPTFNETILEWPTGSSDGLRLNVAMCLGINDDSKYRNPQFKTPENQEWDRVWTESDDQYSVVWSLTADESQQAAAIMNDISTYVQEQTIKAITDDAVLADWDNIVANIKSMRIDEALQIYQDGYDRYNNR